MLNVLNRRRLYCNAISVRKCASAFWFTSIFHLYACRAHPTPFTTSITISTCDQFLTSSSPDLVPFRLIPLFCGHGVHVPCWWAVGPLFPTTPCPPVLYSTCLPGGAIPSPGIPFPGGVHTRAANASRVGRGGRCPHTHAHHPPRTVGLPLPYRQAILPQPLRKLRACLFPGIPV